MKRKFLSLLCVVALIFSLASCDILTQILGEEPAHEHTFADATCTAPKTCACGETEGAALGHTFVDGTCACGAADPNYVPPHTHDFAPATCTAPKTCSCGATEGAALGHTFAPATCTAPKTCACGATEGEALPHDFAAATCTAPKTCACGATEGEALPHTYVDGTCACGAADPDYVPHTHSFADATCTAPKTCACGATEGEALGHTFADATCTAPKTCACGATEGEALPHTYDNGKCECGAIDPNHTHTYTSGICGICGGPDLSFSASMTVPAAPSVDFLEGTWYGEEIGNPDHADADANYEGTHTFVITLDASGRGTVKHSLRGTLNVYSCAINGNTVTLWTQVGGIHLVYNSDNGSFTLRTEQSTDLNFTKGTDLQMIKVDGKDIAPAHECEHACATCGKCTDTACTDAACADKCAGHSTTPAAPSELTEEYLTGTWYGTEIGWDGNTYTFTITFNEYGKGTATHSSLGNFNVTSIIDGGDLLHIMFDFGSYQTSLDYANGTLTLMDGMKNFTNGRETMTMSKTAPAPAHECEHVCVECGKCTDADCTEDACADKCEGHTPAAPDTLTEEYLVGTWYGTETDWQGNTHTFTITFDENGKGAVTHSSLGNFNVSSIIDGNKVHLMYDFGSYQTTLEYNKGEFTLMYTKNFTNGSDVCTMSKTAPAPAHECEHVCVECGKCTDADCTEDACADKCEGHTPAAPDTLTEEYLVGTWYGTETDWQGNTHTFTITFDENGKGAVTHSSLGNFNVSSIIDGNKVHLMYDFGSYQTTLEYNKGEFTLMYTKNFTNGSDVCTMSKTAPAPAPAHECESACATCGKCTDADCTEDACADKCQGHAPAIPENLTEEYLVGTWTGSEVGGFWYSGTYTFTITFNADGSATMTHSEFGDVEIYDYYTEGNTLMIMCSAENSSVALEYANGSFTVLEGGKGFTYGTEFTMTKTA